MGRGREKEVQYKETAVFELFPALEYTKAQKQRLILFHAYKNNIRRIINYAAHFDKPNCVCVAYIVGEVAPEKIQKLLADAECSDRVCVLTSAYPDSDMAFWRDFDKRREIMRKQGFWDDEAQALNDNFRQHYETTAQWVELIEADAPDVDGQIGLDVFQFQQGTRLLESVENDLRKCGETLEAVKHYHALAKKAPTHFRRWTLHRRGQEPTPFRHADTDKLIKKIYPYGAEARGVNPYAGLSPASVEPAAKLVTDGAENRRLGFDRAFVMDFKPVRKIRKFVENAFAAQGYCTLSALADFIKSPPFGLDNNGYSAAILSAALYDIPGLLFFDSLTDSPLQREGMLYLCRKILPQEDSRPSYARMRQESCLYMEYPCHRIVRDALTKLYELEDCTGRYVVTYARAKIETLFLLPLSVSDDLLFRLTGPEIRWHDRAQMEELAAEVTARRGELPSVLAAHIAKDRMIPYRERVSSAACWLWDRETALDSPHFMMNDEERAQFKGYHERRKYWEERKSAAVSANDTQAFWDADKKSIEESRAEMAYLNGRLEPCRRRLEALCEKSP